MSDFVITSRCDWTPEKIERVYREIEKIALEELELDVYPNVLEVITSEQMLDAYAAIGLPVNYPHWSFGKEFMKDSKAYAKGRMGLAYEIVVNTRPTVSYLMEDNDMVMQTLVIAHAAFGHNAFFKNNIYFQEWTDAGNIIDYMIFARDYIRKCEERYGAETVELVLDAAHALAPHGVDKFKRKHNAKVSEEVRLQTLLKEEDDRQRELDIIIKRTSTSSDVVEVEQDEDADEENLLYYIMKKAPSLDQWKREILRIVYKINQYFYPQSQTQTANEGFATFTHHYIMNRLEEKGILSPDAFISFMRSHVGVIGQPSYDSPYSSGFNPYALGFAIYSDIKRICENPTDEDREWFPQLIGARWQDVIKQAAFNHRDDSFIAQYLSPKVIRDLKLFVVNVERTKKMSGTAVSATVTDIHDDEGYRSLRTALARSYERINRVPQIKAVGADLGGDRTLKLEYIPFKGRKLDMQEVEQVMEYVDYLWGYAVELSC